MTVYVVQKQTKFNQETGNEELRYPEIIQASQFGVISYLLTQSANPFRPETTIRDLHRRLSNFSSGDYLVPIGSPAIVGIAMSIISQSNDGVFNILQWSSRYNDYVPVSIRI